MSLHFWQSKILARYSSHSKPSTGPDARGNSTNIRKINWPLPLFCLSSILHSSWVLSSHFLCQAHWYFKDLYVPPSQSIFVLKGAMGMVVSTLKKWMHNLKFWAFLSQRSWAEGFPRDPQIRKYKKILELRHENGNFFNHLLNTVIVWFLVMSLSSVDGQVTTLFHRVIQGSPPLCFSTLLWALVVLSIQE